MINPNLFIEFLIKKGINFFSGVPDSLLKELSFCFDEKIDSENHKITANNHFRKKICPRLDLALVNLSISPKL